VSASLDLSMLQNCFGRYFIMSGSSICNFARLRAQHCLYALYALRAGGLDPPYDYLVCVQCCFAYLHSSHCTMVPYVFPTYWDSCLG
jgi:hypothetical protein